MRITYSRIAAAVFSGLLLATSAGAAVLWDQSVIAPAGPGITNSNSPGFGGFVRHSVNDVTVPASGWHITQIKEWYAAFNTGWIGGVTQGFINVQSKTGALPTLAPVAVQSPMTAAIDAAQSALLGQSVIVVTANVNINLTPGDYWIGLTPSGSAGINGANLQWPAVMVGDPVATYAAPGPWVNAYPNYDGSFIINGDIPTVAVESKPWAAVKALYQ